jgi:hypothetical protein
MLSIKSTGPASGGLRTAATKAPAMTEKEEDRPRSVSAAGIHRDDWKAKARALQREFSKENREQNAGAEQAGRGTEKPAASHDLEPSILDKKEGARARSPGRGEGRARGAAGPLQVARARSRSQPVGRDDKMKLPRGASSDNFGLPTATARWATREEILSYAHREGAIRVGTTPAPHPDAKQYLDLLAAVDDELAKNELLDPAWKARQHALIQQFREALEVSSRASIGINDDRHMITVAGSRAGKLTTAIAGVLCEYPGSVIATDPKGELSKLTAARRGRGSARCKGMNKPTYVVDGYRVSDLPDEFMASFNPLDLLDPKDDQVIDRASMIVNAIVIRAGGDHSHFDDNAIGFLKGLLLYIVSTEERSDSRNLIRLYDLANCGLKQKSSARGSDGDDEDDASSISSTRCHDAKLWMV